MHITCDHCHARYLVKASDIGAKGRKVKCTACHHVWHQGPADAAEQEIIQKIQQDLHKSRKVFQDAGKQLREEREQVRNLPIIIKEPETHKAPLWMKAATIVNCVLILSIVVAINSALIVKTIPSLASIFHGLGIYSAEDVIIEQVDAKIIPDIEGKKRMIIKGALRSQAKDVRDMRLHISLYDDAKKKLAEHPIKLKHTQLKPYERSFFRIPIAVEELPETATYIALDVGNRVEHYLR